jgi:hypothetical protein
VCRRIDRYVKKKDVEKVVGAFPARFLVGTVVPTPRKMNPALECLARGASPQKKNSCGSTVGYVSGGTGAKTYHLVVVGFPSANFRPLANLWSVLRPKNPTGA